MKNKLRSLGYFLLLVLISAMTGYFVGMSGLVVSLTMEAFLWFILFCIISFVLHIFIHEGGHAFFGKLSGYKLLSFRLFSWVIIRNEQHEWAIKKAKVPGTLGQCIMIPTKQEDFHFKLYLLGGGLANLITSFLLLLLFPTSSFSWAYFLIGVLIALMNLIPMGFNDGKTLQLAMQSPENTHKLWIQLDVVQRMMKGESYQEFPDSYFNIPRIETEKKATYLDDYLDFLLLGLLLEKNEWEKASVFISKKWEKHSTLILPYQLELKKQAFYVWGYLRSHEDEMGVLKKDVTLTKYLKEKKAENVLIKSVIIWREQSDPVAALEKLDLAETLLDLEIYQSEKKIISEKIDCFRNEIVNEMIN